MAFPKLTPDLGGLWEAPVQAGVWTVLPSQHLLALGLTASKLGITSGHLVIGSSLALSGWNAEHQAGNQTSTLSGTGGMAKASGKAEGHQEGWFLSKARAG